VPAQVRLAGSVDEAAVLVRRDDIDEAPVLHGGFSAPPAPAADATATAVRVTRHSANGTEIEVHATGAAWLVVKQPFHPYWRAFVNGQEREVWQANLAFMAVPLSAGSNRVQLRYDDAATAIAGAWIALVAVTAMLGAIFAPFGESREGVGRGRVAASGVMRTA
jgi:hypothetical protein